MFFHNRILKSDNFFSVVLDINLNIISENVRSTIWITAFHTTWLWNIKVTPRENQSEIDQAIQCSLFSSRHVQGLNLQINVYNNWMRWSNEGQFP